MKQKITVSVVYATKSQQWQHNASISRGMSVGDLITQSDVLNVITDLRNVSLEDIDVGIFAQKTTLDTLLTEGDRVEIYRPLKADPKTVRRELAKCGKTIGAKRTSI